MYANREITHPLSDNKDNVLNLILSSVDGGYIEIYGHICVVECKNAISKELYDEINNNFQGTGTLSSLPWPSFFEVNGKYNNYKTSQFEMKLKYTVFLSNDSKLSLTFYLKSLALKKSSELSQNQFKKWLKENPENIVEKTPLFNCSIQ